MRQLLETTHPSGLPDERLCRYGLQTLLGLHFLHEHLVIHRDLKGENLLLLSAERLDTGCGHVTVRSRVSRVCGISFVFSYLL